MAKCQVYYFVDSTLYSKLICDFVSNQQTAGLENGIFTIVNWNAIFSFAFRTIFVCNETLNCNEIRKRFRGKESDDQESISSIGVKIWDRTTGTWKVKISMCSNKNLLNSPIVLSYPFTNVHSHQRIQWTLTTFATKEEKKYKIAFPFRFIEFKLI